jgi:hypothetical protein
MKRKRENSTCDETIVEWFKSRPPEINDMLLIDLWHVVVDYIRCAHNYSMNMDRFLHPDFAFQAPSVESTHWPLRDEHITCPIDTLDARILILTNELVLIGPLQHGAHLTVCPGGRFNDQKTIILHDGTHPFVDTLKKTTDRRPHNLAFIESIRCSPFEVTTRLHSPIVYGPRPQLIFKYDSHYLKWIAPEYARQPTNDFYMDHLFFFDHPEAFEHDLDLLFLFVLLFGRCRNENARKNILSKLIRHPFNRMVGGAIPNSGDCRPSNPIAFEVPFVDAFKVMHWVSRMNFHDG